MPPRTEDRVDRGSGNTRGAYRRGSLSVRVWVIIALAVLSACGDGGNTVSLPTPGPSSLLLTSEDSTFRIVGVVESGGVRTGEGDTSIGPDGYAATMGTIYLERVVELHSSAACGIPDLLEPPAINFGPRWIRDDVMPDPSRTPGLPTRFDWPSGTNIVKELDGARIQVWGAFPRGRCSLINAQYVEAVT